MNPTEFLTTLGGCVHVIATSYGLVLSLLVAGLVGGVTHCAMMCGPFVLSQSGDLQRVRDALLIPYHVGRITTYTALAVLLSGVLNLAFLFLPIRSLVVAPVLMVAGLVFLVNAFPQLGKVFPWVSRIKMAVPYYWISGAIAKLSKNNSFVQKYLMGVLLGFMPCGLIVSALMAAATAPNAMQAGLAMTAFGVGTMPALIGTALGGQALRIKHPALMRRVTQGMMVWSSLWLFALAGFLLI